MFEKNTPAAVRAAAGVFLYCLGAELLPKLGVERIEAGENVLAMAKHLSAHGLQRLPLHGSGFGIEAVGIAD